MRLYRSQRLRLNLLKCSSTNACDLSKSDEKVVYSRGLKTYLVADILDEDILCPYHLDDENETKYILSPNFTCITDGEILGTVSPNIIAQMPKCN